jgi:hypothetical protein
MGGTGYEAGRGLDDHELDPREADARWLVLVQTGQFTVHKFFKDGTIVYFHSEGSVSMVGTNDAYRLDDFSGEWLGPLVLP